MGDLVILLTGAIVGIVVFNLVMLGLKKKDN